MKIIVIENAFKSSPVEEPSVMVYPDTCLFRNNDPFYIPDLQQRTIMRAGCLIKIDKIGKCIDVQFANRYFSQVGLGFDFIQADFRNSLLTKGLDGGPAVYFDRSLAASNGCVELEHFRSLRTTYRVKFNESELSLSEQSARFTFDQAVSIASQYFTLKIGDYVFVPAVSFDKGVKQGDIIDGAFQNNILLRCVVK